MLSLDLLFQHPPSPIEELHDPLLASRGLRLFIKRDELLRLGPALALCGNKWRKLQYNLLAAREAGHHTLLTFGGAFSNHLAAVAAAGQAFGFETIGIVRGERPTALNPTLRFVERCGMRLHYLSRGEYRAKQTPAFQEELRRRCGHFYLLPEGGTNGLALQGCLEMAAEIEQQLEPWPHTCCLSVGTGGTMAGLVAGLRGRSKVLGFSALKGDFLAGEVRRLLETHFPGQAFTDWSVNADFHAGGYAKTNPALLAFMDRFCQEQGILLDPIYTGKLFWGLFQLIETGYFPAGSSILAIHTGGLQGIAGFQERK
jgi:1-aminocyclopropane-1-carboxylate deaminase/D-cysteine desulfhydrase-like pyridoxal-dependent ACC family enzyme